MIHITGGEHKGRKLLPPPRGAGLRPMTGSIRESLFATLGGRVQGAAVADLFCAAGTVGLEALSRGAAWCCFAERNRSAVARLKRNIEAMGLEEKTVVWRGDVTKRLEGWLGKFDGGLDLVFVDPPHAMCRPRPLEAIRCGVIVPASEHLNPDGLIVLRIPKKADPPEDLPAMAITRQKRYSHETLVFYEHEGEVY